MAFAVLSAPALAQDEAGPLRFLKPWLDRQIYGEEPPQQDASEANAAAPDAVGEPVAPPAEAAPARVEDLPPAAEPSDDATAGVEPEPSDAAVDASKPTAPPPAQSRDRAEPPAVPLRFAVLAGRDVSATMRAIGPMGDELGEALGRPVEMLPMSSYAAMIDAQTERRVDGGFYSAASFAQAEAGCDCLEPLVAPRAADATLAFHALIVARNDSGIDSPADLDGKIVAVGAADSMGARRMQLAGLLEASIDPATFLDGVIELESADAAVRAAVSGDADAAFAWSSLSGNAGRGYSRGTLTDLVAAGEIAMNEIAIVWRSPPIAHGPFAVLSTLPEADKERIASYLLTLYARNPAAYDMLNPLYPGGYAAVDPGDYSGVSALVTMDVDAVTLPRAGPTEVGPATPE